uniref:Glycosyltransferase family 92 protein n=1 Tax=Panagrellus redivivus TaxID=6233 RepID=A0A7E4W1L5_PANRE
MQIQPLINTPRCSNVPLQKVYGTAKYVITMMLIVAVFISTKIDLPFRRRFAMVTLFSENHICEAIHSCMTFSTFPKIVSGEIQVFAFYSSDVTPKSLKAYKKACPSVHLHQMDFTGVPEYIKDLSNYRFKYLMVNKILPSFDAVLYIDASIILKPSKKGDDLANIINSVFTDFKHTGFRTFHRSFHSNYPVTHENMYNFFNITQKEMKKTKQIQSGTYVVANSPQGNEVFKGLIDCAIEPGCMAPPGATAKCNMQHIQRNDAITCHRFDQSAMNMRLIELYGTNPSNYYLPSDMIAISRAEMVVNKKAYRRVCDRYFES